MQGSSSWLSQMLANVAREYMAKAAAKGETVQGKVHPVYLAELRSILRAYARVGTADAAMRMLILNLIFCAGGRAIEVATLVWETLVWDSDLSTAVFTWYETKTGNEKHVPMFCGPGDDGNGTGVCGSGCQDVFKNWANALAFGNFFQRSIGDSESDVETARLTA